MARRTLDHADDRRSYPTEERRGLHVATRIALLVAVVGSVAYVAYAVLAVRDTSAIPMLASGAIVLGIAFLAVGIAAAVAMNRASRERRNRDAILLALGGGIAVVIAMGAFAGAAVLALLQQGPAGG